jgi:hypothetical protein
LQVAKGPTADATHGLYPELTLGHLRVAVVTVPWRMDRLHHYDHHPGEAPAAGGPPAAP